MSILSRIFGTTGTLKFSGTTKEFVTFRGKVRVESIGMSANEILQKLVRKLEFEQDIQVSTITVDDFLED